METLHGYSGLAEQPQCLQIVAVTVDHAAVLVAPPYPLEVKLVNFSSWHDLVQNTLPVASYYVVVDQIWN